ncbi:MAG: tripeptide aminopeptidase PepT, partial [Chitinophagaceae bacterium]
MLQDYKFTVTEKFLQYVQIDTQSDPESVTFPSTEKQKNLSVILAEQLEQMGAKNVYTDIYGYVYATIPSNSHKNVPSICFCSHIDTAPDCDGTNVKPILHKHFNGEPIVLPDDNQQIINTNQYPYLLQHIGSDIITASGTTLLGADDKSGVAIIMDVANYLLTHPEIIHGTVQIVFTPDEEVGAGTTHIDLERINAAVAYTLDGGEAGTLEDETFSADGVTI